MTGDDRRPLLCRQLADENTWYSITGFVLALGYPLLFPLRKLLKGLFDEAKPDKWSSWQQLPRRWWVTLCFLSAFYIYTFASWFLPCIVLIIVKSIGVTSYPFPQFVMVTVFLITITNLLLYAVVLSVEYPRLIREEFSTEASNFSEAAKSHVWEWQEKILGHKLWAGEKTHGLFKELTEASLDHQRAKWLMVNFLSEVVEDVLKTEKETSTTGTATGAPPSQSQDLEANVKAKYTISTAEAWSDCRYSRFLDRNMEHARTVWWLVDPTDFFSTLLPDFAAYALASIGWNKYRYDIKLTPNTYRRIDKIIRSGEFTPGFVPDYRTDVFVNLQAIDDDAKLRELREKVLPVMAQIGFRALDESNGEYRDAMYSPASEQYKREKQDLHRGYRKCFDLHLAALLPHVDAFRRCSSQKRRIIFLGYDPMDNQDDFRGVVNEQWSKGKFMMALQKVCNVDDASNISRDNFRCLIAAALELFAYTCGDYENCGVASSATREDDKRKSYDVGIYDHRFVVNATPVDQEDQEDQKDLGRNIKWSYYAVDGNGPPDARFFDGSDENVHIRSFQDFAGVFLRII